MKFYLQRINTFGTIKMKSVHLSTQPYQFVPAPAQLLTFPPVRRGINLTYATF